MNSVYPRLIWDVDTFHRELMRAIDDSFHCLREAADFDDQWRSCRTVPGTKTTIRQTPLLGRGGQGRCDGGLYKFAERYVAAEGRATAEANERCCFERYGDFVFYANDEWWEGNKLPALAVEVESKNAELLGELSGLLSVRSPFKYLFISSAPDILSRLTAYCGDPCRLAVDWAQTTYFVIEIPDEPIPPSQWKSDRADVQQHGEKLCFRPVREE
ncbi:MAG: hypothetical protein HY000_37300 [Planctomycetes bacterium]|nr:hypothetical protein [Planctomycetota bacterium]